MMADRVLKLLISCEMGILPAQSRKCKYDLQLWFYNYGFTTMVLQTVSAPSLTIAWEKLPDDYRLPDDPVENIQHPLLAAALTDALGEAGLIQPEMLVASNFGLVATINQKTIVKAPDWLLVPKVLPVNVIRRSYTPHLEGDAVAIVIEFLSETETGEYSVRPTYPYGKLYFYEQILKVPTYVIFDPHDRLLEVRQLEGSQYVLRSPTAEGRFWIPELGLWLGSWHGTRLGTSTEWLRWWDDAGTLLLWSAEKAEQERQRAEAAEQELARLRAQLQDQQAH
jgi:Uma2 family endonuclease